MSEDLDLFSGKPKKSFSIKDFINKGVANWPVFLIGLAICIGTAFFYLRYAVPKFSASTLILVKGSSSSERGDLVETALTGELHSNFNFGNELVLLRSGSLMERVVLKNEFNISYFHVGSVQKRDIYLDAPFRLIPQAINDSSTAVTLKIEDLNDVGGNIKYGDKEAPQKFSFKWNQPFKTAGKTFVLAKKGDNSGDDTYLVTWKPVKAAAGEILSTFTAAMMSKDVSIIKLDIIIENSRRGRDILNSIVKEYNLSDIEDRTIITRNTLRFIDDRLAIVSNELSGVEGNLESYQGRNEIVNLTTQSSQSFGNANDVSISLKEINVKQGVVQMIRNYFNNPAAQDKLVPSTMGLEDGTLSSLIAKYNELQLTKQREAPMVAMNSTVMQDLNNQINNVRGSILESLQNINSNLKLQENSLQQQNGQYQQFLSSLPRKERVMQEIKRKQSITEGLYLYLLQKREESAISSTSSSISNYKQIEPAKGGEQIEPNTLNVKLYSVILGLLLPLGWIYAKDKLNDKIISREDFTDVVDLPVLGDINHISKTKNSTDIVVMERNVFAEQFRIIRTNLSITVKKKDKQVILVSSSVSGEGKSFVSLNLAAVLAVPGKTVALLQFDLRKPETKGAYPNSKGIADYLNGTARDLSVCILYQRKYLLFTFIRQVL
jgi:uncharacterized protein involved in exopolysaccharide biosynthesis